MEQKNKPKTKNKVESIVSEGKKYYKYHGIYVTETGEFFNKNFKRILPKKNVIWFTDSERVKEKNKVRRRGLRAGKVVIEACTGREVLKKDIIIYLDGDDSNYALSNLKIIQKYKCPPEVRKQIVDEYNYEERRKHNFKGQWSKPTFKELEEKYKLSSLTIYNYVVKDLEKKGITPRKRTRKETAKKNEKKQTCKNSINDNALDDNIRDVSMQ